MSDYKFVDWADVLFEKHGLNIKDFSKEDYESYTKDKKQPDLAEFIQHHTDEGFKALEAGIVDDCRWNRLITEIEQTVKAISHKNISISLIAKAFYDLGRAREALDHATVTEMIELSKSKISTIKRETPLIMINLGRKYAKEAAQEIAQKKWDDDTEQSMRLAEMCKIVDEEIIKNHKTFMEFLPENPNDMKKWLRPIAPDWAKKGGRPRKRSKK